MAQKHPADPEAYDRNQIIPHLVYEDVGLAVEWLAKNFGFVELERFRKVGPGGVLYHAEMRTSSTGPRIFLGPPGGDIAETPLRTGRASNALHVYVDDIDEHFKNTTENGAKVFLRCETTAPIERPELQFYGDLVYWTMDLDGHYWVFHQRVAEVAPEDWRWNVPLKMIPRAPLPHETETA